MLEAGSPIRREAYRSLHCVRKLWCAGWNVTMTDTQEDKGHASVRRYSTDEDRGDTSLSGGMHRSCYPGVPLRMNWFSLIGQYWLSQHSICSAQQAIPSGRSIKCRASYFGISACLRGPLIHINARFAADNMRAKSSPDCLCLP